ncbi:MAG: AraC family transcriptional regulator [Pseudomonadota bacterium]
MTQGTTKTLFSWENFGTVCWDIFGARDPSHTISHSDFGAFHKLEADDQHCSGRLEFYEFTDELLVTIIDCVWFEEHEFLIQDGDWIRFNFSLSIDIDMHLSRDQTVKIVRPSWRIINYPPDKTVVETIPANKRSAWITICCKRALVEQLTGENCDNLPSLLREQVSLSGKENFHHFHDFTSRLNAITADVLKTQLTAAMRMAYIRSRAVELICLALDHLVHSPVNVEAVKLTEKDEQALARARNILLEDLAATPSISDLSLQLGLNRNKLYYGFKRQYGCSVSEFLQSQRLEEGKRLLQHTDMAISDISLQIGYQHQSSFTAAMKKYYGLTPKQFRG